MEKDKGKGNIFFVQEIFYVIRSRHTLLQTLFKNYQKQNTSVITTFFINFDKMSCTILTHNSFLLNMPLTIFKRT